MMWPRTLATTLSLACVLTVANVSPSAACPAGQYQRCVLGACVCLPEIGGAVGQGFEHLKKEIPGQLGGVPLEQWIIASHNTAINGTMPIPPEIRQDLTGYASEDSMNRVRYKIGDNGLLNLANVIEKGGPATAVTLIDVVIFRGPSEASDRSLWAHELTHVDQYQAWGVHSFAIQYARDYNSVEAPAYAKQNGYLAWAQGRGLSMAGATPAPSPGFGSGMGHLCVVSPPRGPYSVRDMGQLYPVGSLCANNPYFGVVQ